MDKKKKVGKFDRKDVVATSRQYRSAGNSSLLNSFFFSHGPDFVLGGKWPNGGGSCRLIVFVPFSKLQINTIKYIIMIIPTLL